MHAQRLLTVVALSAVIATAPAWGARGAGRWGTPPSDQIVDAGEAATLTFMREEERLARDLYHQFHEIWESVLFVNISAAEQRHMDAVKNAMDKYALPDPSNPALVGEYSYPELQQLHNQLLAQGEQSYLEALWAGGMVEEMDIADLRDAIVATDNDDLKKLYENLLRGSRNHLRAYAAEIERMGVIYEAQYLKQTDVDKILNSSMERGSEGKGRGRNGRGGKGQGGKG